MKKTAVFILNLILLTILETFFRIIVRDGIGSYFRNFELYSFELELLASTVFVLLIMLVYAFLFKVVVKNQSTLVQACVTGLLGATFFYLLHAFGGGFTAMFEITFEVLIGIIRLFIIGFLLPFSERWIASLLNKFWKN